MSSKKGGSLLSQIPAVESLLEHPVAKDLLRIYSRPFIRDAIREYLDLLRTKIREGQGERRSLDLSPEGILEKVEILMKARGESNLKGVVNATGILLHTGLGRALLADKAVEAMERAAESFCNLELSLQDGKRGHRDVHVENLLCRLTGAEGATVVNNNAAAVLLGLNTLAEGKEVIISRGQLIEIGGSFRLPEVVAKSGARLVEVGTTNRTYLKDYERAITDRTGALLCVHPSNFIVVGFTADVAVEDLVALGAQRRLPVVYDLGSGALVDLSQYGLEKEPVAKECVESGADLVTFSGDKLLGGPQAGIIVGEKALVERVRKNPLRRALRVDKSTLAALEATLRIYLTEPDIAAKLPILRFLTRPLEDIERSASKIIEDLLLDLRGKVEMSLEDGLSRVGGGSLPAESLPTKLIALRPLRISPDELAARLRQQLIPIIGRIHQDRVLLDVRTIRTSEESHVRSTLKTLDYN
ncbi:MAG: L-seryl-tRNA(Sec) selenium transferase [bacterium]